MGKGSSKTSNNKSRRYYTFTLSENNESDKELIDFLENRSTTASVKEGLRLLMEKQNNNNSDILQALAALSALNTGNDLFKKLEKLQQQVVNGQEQSAAKENNKNNSEEQKKIKTGTKKALAALNNYKW